MRSSSATASRSRSAARRGGPTAPRSRRPAGSRRSSSPSARNPIRPSCPKAPGIEISGWAGVVADARTLSTGQAGVFAGGDVVSGPKTIIDAVAAGRRAAGSIHGYLAGVADPEAEILRTVRYPTPHEADADRRPDDRGRGPIRRSTSSIPRPSRRRRPASSPAIAVAEAGRCFRCDAVDRCVERPRPRRPRSGRPARRPASDRRSPARLRRAPQSQEVCNDPGTGLAASSMPARASSKERSRRRSSCSGRSPWRCTSAGRTWSGTPASSPSGSARTCGGSSTSRCAT